MINRSSEIGCLADFGSELAADAYEELVNKYNLLDAESFSLDYFNLIITLGGDGMMLKALHRYMNQRVSMFGMNRGSVGFLLNEYSPHKLIERLNNAVTTKLYPLEMTVRTVSGDNYTELAINEVSLLRETNQAARIKISINDIVRLDCLVADGVLISTPAGSSAYNFAAHGPVLPLNSNVLALTPICPFRPRRWQGAILPSHSKICFDILDPHKRPVSAVADSTEIRDVVSVEVKERTDLEMKLLFDKDNGFEDRLLKEQFMG